MIDVERLWRHDEEPRFAAATHYAQRLHDLVAAGSKHAAAIVRRAWTAEMDDPEPPRTPKLWYER